MNISNAGSTIANGTWTSALGLVQSGYVDMWATDAYMTSTRFDSFLFTTPFTIEKYAALMKRPIEQFAINYNTLTASIHASVYVCLFAIMRASCVVC
jgi:hypothetical protein